MKNGKKAGVIIQAAGRTLLIEYKDMTDKIAAALVLEK